VRKTGRIRKRVLVRVITRGPSTDVTAGGGDNELNGQRRPVAARRARDHSDVCAGGNRAPAKTKAIKIRSIRTRYLNPSGEEDQEGREKD
jgi:hypothetical protein